MMVALLVAHLLTAPVALAENARQIAHSAEEGPEEVALEMSWKTASGADKVAFTVSTAELAVDKSIKRKLQLEDLYTALAKAARQSAKDRKKVQLTAKVTPSGVQLGASGPPKAAKAAMADAQTAMTEARVAWMKENRIYEPKPGVLSFDHALIVAERSSTLGSLAAALREGTSSDREFIERSLAFSQAIPYQAGKKGRDTGFQHPLALVVRNKGDCDGKAALFLAIVHAELPELLLAMVYVPGHALVGVGLPPEKDDQSFKDGGVEYIFAEPVGPGAVPLGQTAPANKRTARSGRVRAVPQ